MAASDIAKKQKKREKYLVRRLVEGLAGWLTFKQASGTSTLLSEYFLYPPIYDIVSGRAWSVLAQEPITGRPPQNGAFSTLDFVFYEKSFASGSRGLILMEVKYLRGENTTLELRGLQRDFKKLRDVAPNKLRNAKSLSKCGAPSRWQIIVAQRKAYTTVSGAKSETSSDIARMLTKAISPKPHPEVYLSVIETRLREKFHWHVVAIGEKGWPLPITRKS